MAQQQPTPARLWSIRRTSITLVGPTQGQEVELLGPIDTNAQHQAFFPTGWWRRRGAVLMDQSSGDDTLLGVRLAVSPPRRCLL